MFLDVVEAKGEDLEDDLKEDFGPRLFFRFGFHNLVVLKIKQKCKIFLFSGTDLEAGFLFGGLFGKPTGGEGLLHGGGDEDTAFTVFREGAAVEADACTSGDLDEDRQGAFETRRVRDLHSIDECRDKVVGIFEGVADIVQTFDEEAGTLVVVMRGAI